MLLSAREERAALIAEELIRKHKERALAVSLGRGNGRFLNRIRESKAIKRFGKEIYIFFGLNEIEKLIRRYSFIFKINKMPKSKFAVLEPSSEEVLGYRSLEFPGGTLNLIRETEEGYMARAYPYSHLSGTEVQAHILAKMLRGIYPKSYSDQGELIWKSVLLRAERAEKILRDLGMNENLRRNLSLESALRSTKLWPIFAILMVDDLTEAYAQLNGNLILEHIIYGKVRVENCIFDAEELSKFITFVEADSSSGFEYRSSMAEVDLNLGERKFRIALDVPPSSRGALDVRNLSAMKRLSLPRLISLGSLTIEQASIILTNLESGSPILIFGRTGVGKTTLANALLAILPRDWRLISVEEVREIEDLSTYGMHHSPYEVPRSKLDFIRFLLHRNPDIVFLGEILTKEQAEAFELAFTSGLRVIATSHARNYEGLERKWGGWGLRIPDETLAILMEDKRVKKIMKWVGGWIPTDDLNAKWMILLDKLKGAETNEEVGRRICELVGLLNAGRLMP